MRVLTMMVQRLWVRLPAPVQKAMQPLIQWVKTYSYAASCIAAVLLVTLWVNIHPVAVAVTAMTQFQSWRVEWQLNREARRYVWCYHRYNPQPENTHIYGAFAGTHPEEVLRFHEVASWLLRSPEQEKSCYRTWRDAADATASFAAEFPALVIGEWNMPTPAEGQRAVREERYRRAVLGAVLDRPVTGLTSGASWCLSRIHTEDYHIYHVPHPVGGREEVERVLEQLSERTHIQHYRINKTACFAHALQAVDWLEKELVTLPDGSSLTDYAETLHRWLGQSANAAG